MIRRYPSRKGLGLANIRLAQSEWGAEKERKVNVSGGETVFEFVWKQNVRIEEGDALMAVRLEQTGRGTR
jgi:hypothetical protein